MRRKDREMPEAFGWEVADKCEWAMVAMVDPSGNPYVVPVSMARAGCCLYFHSAQSGFKTECLNSHPEVCVCCVGDTHRVPEDFTTEYESAILRGMAVEVTDEAEKIRALRLICMRHAEAGMERFDEVITRSLSKTAIWRIDVFELTAKRKKYDAQGKEMKFGRME